MSETVSTDTAAPEAPVTETPAVEDSAPEADAPATFTAEYVGALRSESAGHRIEARDNKSALDAANVRVSELEAASTAATAAADAATARSLRLEVALEKGLPLDLATRLNGTTREDLAADADALASHLGKRATGADTGQGNRGAAAVTDGLKRFSLADLQSNGTLAR